MNKTHKLLESLVGEAKPVIVKSKVHEVWVCPHCNEDIQEKSIFSGRSVNEHRHGPCNGLLKLPGPTKETVEFLKSRWGIEIKEPIFEGDGQEGYDVPPGEETREVQALKRADELLGNLRTVVASVPGYNRRQTLSELVNAIHSLVRDAQGLPHHRTFAQDLAAAPAIMPPSS